MSSGWYILYVPPAYSTFFVNALITLFALLCIAQKLHNLLQFLQVFSQLLAFDDKQGVPVAVAQRAQGH